MTRAKILTVDDDPKVSFLVRALLENMGGYEVREENRSYAALTTAREFGPQLIILDVDMPGMDGPMVAQQLRADRHLARIPVVFLSSLVTPCEHGWSGRHYFLAKPVNPSALLRTVHMLLPHHAAAPRLRTKSPAQPGNNARHE